MKIAFVHDNIYPYNIGGVSKRTWELASRLAQRGHDVTLFGMKHWEGADTIERDGVRLWGVCPPQKLFANHRRSIKGPIYFALSVLPALLKERFDIIDCQHTTYFPGFSAKFHSLARQSRLIVTWQEIWDDFWYEYLGKRGFFGKSVERLLMRLPHMNVACTRCNVDKLISIGIDERKVAYVPTGGLAFEDIQRIPPANEKAEIIFVGRLIKAKMVHVLLQAAAYLKENSPEVSVAIIGDGPERDNLEALSRNLNVDDIVKFYGIIQSETEVISLMKSAKIFVYPTSPEGGWSISVLEANACGLPAVSVQSGILGTNEVVVDGYNGLVASEQSAELIADKITLLLENESLRKTLGANALNFAMEQDWDIVADRVEEVYAEVLR